MGLRGRRKFDWCIDDLMRAASHKGRDDAGDMMSMTHTEEINRFQKTDVRKRAFDNRARQLYKNISMLFLFPVTRDLLFTNI